MATFDIWISEVKASESGKKYAVKHSHSEVLMKHNGYDSGDAGAPTMLVAIDKYSVMVLCENYQRGKMVKTWRVHKTFPDKAGAIGFFKRIR